MLQPAIYQQATLEKSRLDPRPDHRRGTLSADEVLRRTWLEQILELKSSFKELNWIR
ncbi:hypothetical protein [Agrobacterium pusense]|uniref:hypothetical protein n=1 Tax=Agrobacterium pusense TaxID=648995 RepID=UPI001C6E917D|nr:hypothetical protein [Agrobacterium pusense]MBW9068871.1 hypothetical protein [Agrobacterium pusense]MBW9084179.1 hypothetical protein [Agrobacterium pusense]MBW9123491.1 hypothetical protein [Agrobacterium pusense]MBW9136078.1 hypothetical protein [Agrobacterium pusense]